MVVQQQGDPFKLCKGSRLTVPKIPIHPTEYVCTRNEWMKLNQALCGARLEMQGKRAYRDEHRLGNIDEALSIISEMYKRAKV